MHPPYEVQPSSGAARGEEEGGGNERKLEEQQQQLRDSQEANNAARVPSKCEFKYVGFEIDWDLFCSLCGYPFVEAVVSSCGHSFCYNCVVDKETQKPREQLECPNDKKKVCIDPEHPTFNIVVNNMADKLIVQCKHSEGGCPWKGERKLFPSHSEQCEFRPAICENGCGKNGAEFIIEEQGGSLKSDNCTGSPYQLIWKNLESHHSVCARRVLDCACGAGVPLYQMPEHLNDECPMQPTSCCYCNESVIRSEFNRHWSRDCQGIPVRCEYESYGCEYSSPRRPMADHVANECPYHKMRGFIRHVTKEVSGLQNKIEKMEERTVALENENSMLKQQLFLLQEKQRIAKTRANEETEARTRERKDAVVTLKVLTQLTQTVQQLQLCVQQNYPSNSSASKSIRHASLQSYFEPNFSLDKTKSITSPIVSSGINNSTSESGFDDDFGQFASFPFCNPPPSHRPASPSSLRSSSSSRLTGTSASSRSPLLGQPSSSQSSSAPISPSPIPSSTASSSSWTAIFDSAAPNNQSPSTSSSSFFSDCK